uniref:Metalloendopeptidase n=1 Tax=Plectus sambesii TaxID=2011161 RepID=A0A914W8Q9_9BILA
MRFLLLLLSVVSAALAVTPDGELEAWDYSRAEQMNPECMEGDIVKPSSQFVERNARNGEQWHWPGARIPYELSDFAGFDVYEQEVMRTARVNYERYTCIRWVPVTANDQDYVSFISGGGCYSYVGRQGGVQQISLMRPDASGASCMLPAIGMHEMMHCSGFYHEQSRPDRDNYVTIYRDNIIPGYEGNFDVCTDCGTLGAAYDYGSVMHYSNDSFSKNASYLPTILPKQVGAEIGQRRGFSWIDVFKLNTYYGCPVPQNVPGPIDQNQNPNVCNFDTDFCGWIQDYKVVLDPNAPDPFLQYADQYDFFRINGTTPSANTGPNGDHTSGNGRYIYTEASYPAAQGDRFRIRTPMITGTGPMCVSFYYSMYAANPSLMGALSVFTLGSSDVKPTTRWSRFNGQQSTPSWSQGSFTVSINGGFQVLFEVTRGSDYQGDIAIDDFAVTAGAC